MAPPSIAKLERDRQATKDIILYLETELTDDVAVPMVEATANHLFGMVTTAQSDIISIHKQIQEVNPPNLPDHQTEFQALLKRLTQLLAAYSGIKSRFVPAVPVPPPHGSAKPQEVRLPRLELPTFDGNLQQWVSFRDLFTNAIHNKTNLSKSEKLTYLKSLVKGDASRLIQTLVVTDANYDIAWSKLIDRYQNERELVFAVFNRFIAQPNLQPQSASAVRDLVDVSLECVRSLEVFSIKLDTGLDAILMFHVFCKLDGATKQLWEQQLKDTKIPTLQALLDFLEQRARSLSASGTNSSSSKSSFKNSVNDRNRSNSPRVHHSQSTSKCRFCGESPHNIFICKQFNSWGIPKRCEAIRKFKLCYNCLGDGHVVENCPSTKTCKVCSNKHHSLLHKPKESQESTSQAKVENSGGQVFHTICNEKTIIPPEFNSILATALVYTPDHQGHNQISRIFGDNGSNSNYITESCATRLGLKRFRYSVESTGLGDNPVLSSNAFTQVMVRSRFDTSISYSIKALIVRKISRCLPLSRYDHTQCTHLQGLPLADPKWYQPQKVDMLLGADVFFTILKDGKKTGPEGSPVAINSEFGWLVGGGTSLQTINQDQINPIVATNLTQEFEGQIYNKRLEPNLNILLQRFWEIEETPGTRFLTKEEEDAEAHFISTFKQDKDGRFIVRLPKRNPCPVLGSSLSLAIKRLHSMERRLQSHPTYRSEYNKFMKEYETLGHMIEINADEDCGSTTCYIPHHFVLKESSSSTKFRVVFDGSAKTTSGVSLNDTMMVGPTIQDPLFDIMVRFRLHYIAFIADVAKMYRQVGVSYEDANLQRIVWREDPSLPIRHFMLVRVTYGTGPGSYLATKSLNMLADIEKDSYPIAASITKRDFYVDDVISGEPSIQAAIKAQQQLLAMTKKGCFDLRKWSSNSQKVLDALPPELRETQSLTSFNAENDTIKTLGIYWNPQDDCFLFRIAPPLPSNVLTKRIILSEIASLFDPIGWLAPVIITAKLLMQTISRHQIGWDDIVPLPLQEQWINYQADLRRLEEFKLPRCFFSGSDVTVPSLNTVPSKKLNSTFHLVGFSDASERAFSACIYICCYQPGHFPTSSLVSSKTRVAPSKTISLPRLELCGALLLADLMTHVRQALKITISSVSAYTDSTVTLAWIQSHPSRWQSFIANRVTKIQNQIPPERWGHVSGKDNPADCASRGIDSTSLINHPLWWHGPSWLRDEVPNPQQQELDPKLGAEEERKVTVSSRSFLWRHPESANSQAVGADWMLARSVTLKDLT